MTTKETKVRSSLFQPLTNEQGYLKAGIMGFPGSGKTFTATEIALGLVSLTKDQRPVFVLDSEKGFEYRQERFKEAGVAVEAARTRAFVDLLAAVDEAETHASVLIVDSITHFWEEVQKAYKARYQRSRLQFQDWGPIKDTWAQYTTKFLNSRLHIIMCGRAGDTYEYTVDEQGNKELEKTGTKMQAEKNLGYEPGLALEMEKASLGRFEKGKRAFVNRCYVLKDRFDVLDGQVFDNPTFETFLPHVQRLNLGSHAPIDGKDSQECFTPGSDSNWTERKKQVEIVLEEIEGEITATVPGQSAEDKRIKADLLQDVFETRSWTAIKEMRLEELRTGLAAVRDWAQVIKTERGTKK